MMSALKPWLLRHLLGATGGPVTYLAPDGHVFGDLAPLWTPSAAVDLVLVPRLLAPLPDDAAWPDERHVHAAGVNEPGALTVFDTDRARALLDAWIDRNRWDAADGEDAGAADRRWTDLLPGMARHELCADPGVAVSYLNVHERPLAIAGEGFTAGGEPLRLFRFIGFDHRRPALLTTVEATGPRRSLLSDDRALRLLCARRVEAVAAADDGAADVPYARDALANGVRLAPAVREVLREASRSARGALDLDARRVADTTAFLLAASDGLPRLARSVHERRPDLAVAYPDPVGDRHDRAGLAGWWRNVAPGELAIDRSLASRVARAIDVPLPPLRPAPSDEASPGSGAVVEIVGFVQAELGIGEAARRLARSLTAAGVGHRVTPYRRNTSSRMAVEAPTGSPLGGSCVDIEVGCVNLDHYPQLARERATVEGPRPYRIGYWWWEVDAFPSQFADSFDLVDEVWCSTEFVANALRREGGPEVVKVPMAITTPVIDASLRRPDLGLPDGFVFLYVFDFFSTMGRKNPLGLIEAFVDAVPAGSGPTLVVKTINGVHRMAQLEQLRLAAIDRPDVRIIDGYVDATTLGSTVAASDCYVSLHRSEGFGLTIADAMALGVPVVATAYGGNLEFMDETNSTLVPSRLVPIGPDNVPYPAEGQWAEPDHAAAVAALRSMVDDAAAHRARAADARRRVLERFAAGRCGAAAAARLDEIRARRAEHARMGR
jgi:glycosyltransferase involved in cell wall biosynthesis